MAVEQRPFPGQKRTPVSLTERGCLTRSGWRKKNRFRLISTLICLPTCCGWDSRAPFKPRATPATHQRVSTNSLTESFSPIGEYEIRAFEMRLVIVDRLDPFRRKLIEGWLQYAAKENLEQ